MPRFISPRGESFDVDEMSPETMRFIQENQLKPVPQAAQAAQAPGALPPISSGLDVAKSGLSGLAEGVARTPMLAADIAKLGLTGLNQVLPGTVSDGTMRQIGSQPWVDAFKDSPQDKWLKNIGLDLTHEPQTRAGRYTKAGTSAVAGAAAMGGLGALGRGGLNAASLALTPSSLAINGGAGLAGELGYDVSRGFDETKQGNPLVALATGSAAAVGGNIVRQVARPNINQTVYNATNDMPARDWKAARSSIDEFNAAGSKTFTLADLPELNPRIGGTAQGLSNTTGGNLLQQKLGDARVNKDIPSILKAAREDITPSVDARQLGNDLTAQGQQRLLALKQNRSTALKGDLTAAGNLDEQVLKASSVPIRLANLDPGNQGTGQLRAIAQAETAMLGKDSLKVPILDDVVPPTTNVRALSQNVKALRKLGLSEAQSPNAAIGRSQGMYAADLAERALGNASPKFKDAMSRYKDFSDNIYNPAKNSAVGGFADGVSDAGGILTQLRKVPPGKLASELSGLSPSDQQKRELARILSDQVSPIPNLAKVGPQATGDRASLKALLDDIDPDLSARVGIKTKVADQLSKLHAEGSADRTMGLNHSQNIISKAISPFGTISMGAGLRTSEKETSRLSQLLGNPTPENLAKLEALSKIDPRAKRALEWISSLTAASQNSSVSNPALPAAP